MPKTNYRSRQLAALHGAAAALHDVGELDKKTMRDIEAEMKTRVRKAGKNEERISANAVWGEFIHFTSRPVDGVPDPHLHAHCFLANVTWDDKEQSWKAGQFRDLKRDSPYFEAISAWLGATRKTSG